VYNKTCSSATSDELAYVLYSSSSVEVEIRAVSKTSIGIQYNPLSHKQKCCGTEEESRQL
jgi:hypothetical protein